MVVSGRGDEITARIRNPRVDGSDFKWDVDIYRTDNWSDPVIGNCDFYFNVNALAFTGDNPTVTYRHTFLQGNNNYNFSTGRAVVNTQCFISLVYTDDTGTDWYPSYQAWEHIFTASLPIDIYSQNSGLEWNSSSTGFKMSNSGDLTVNPSLSGSGDISLPVEMTHITATSESQIGIVLNWQTESEVNSLGFHIWRSEDVKTNFSKITTEIIKSQGNSSQPHEYHYTDRDVREGILYWYKIEELSTNGESTFFGPISITGVDAIPTDYGLSHNYPNPFNPETSFYFDLPKDSKVTIKVYTLLGKVVKNLVDENRTSGRYRVTWQGLDEAGQKVPSGIYFLRMEANDFRQMRKMTVIR